MKLPFVITVQEDLRCTPIEVDKCRVDYRCNFGFPTGWRAGLARLLTYRERDRWTDQLLAQGTSNAETDKGNCKR